MSLEAVIKSLEEIGRGLEETKDEPQNDVPADMHGTNPGFQNAFMMVPLEPGETQARCLHDFMGSNTLLNLKKPAI